jgi:hypothetical protein
MSSAKQGIRVSRRKLLLSGTAIALASPGGWLLARTPRSSGATDVAKWSFAGPFEKSRVLIDSPFVNSWLRVDAMSCWKRDYWQDCPDLYHIRFSFADSSIKDGKLVEPYKIRMRVLVTDKAGGTHIVANKLVEYSFVPWDFGSRGTTTSSCYGGVYTLPKKLKDISVIHVELSQIAVKIAQESRLHAVRHGSA